MNWSQDEANCSFFFIFRRIIDRLHFEVHSWGILTLQKNCVVQGKYESIVLCC